MQEPESNIITKSESTIADLSKLSLECLAKRLREREVVIQSSRLEATTKALFTVERVVDQGRDLIEVKKRLEYGDWMAWVSKHCPMIHHRTATNYIALAERIETVSNLEDYRNVTELYVACGILPPREAKPTEPHAVSVERGPVEWMGRAFQWWERHGGIDGVEPNIKRGLKEAIKPWVEIYPLL